MTWNCGCPTTAAASPPSAFPRCWPGTGGGIGLSNVDARLRATFGEHYGLRIDSRPGAGTTVIMSVPNLGADRASRVGRAAAGVAA